MNVARPKGAQARRRSTKPVHRLSICVRIQRYAVCVSVYVCVCNVLRASYSKMLIRAHQISQRAQDDDGNVDVGCYRCWFHFYILGSSAYRTASQHILHVFVFVFYRKYGQRAERKELIVWLNLPLCIAGVCRAVLLCQNWNKKLPIRDVIVICYLLCDAYMRHVRTTGSRDQHPSTSKRRICKNKTYCLKWAKWFMRNRQYKQPILFELHLLWGIRPYNTPTAIELAI